MKYLETVSSTAQQQEEEKHKPTKHACEVPITASQQTKIQNNQQFKAIWIEM